jgi:signal transduction histidine kinase
MHGKDQMIASLKLEIEQYKKKCEELENKIEAKVNIKRAIFSNLSHEMRTPLNGIIGFSEILNTATVSPEELKLYAGVIEESSLMLMSILKDVFDISRLCTGTFRAYSAPFDLNSLLFDVYSKYKPQAESKQLQLFLENLISEEFVVISDPDVIIRILSKIIENAIKFTKSGWIKVSYKVEEEFVIFSVEDTGIGITKSLHPNLFTRFINEEISKSRHLGGTGLDLTLCNGLVELLGGRMSFESTLGEGTIFHFSFLKKTSD